MVNRSTKPTRGVQARVGETFTVTLDSRADPAFRWGVLATDETKPQLLDQSDAKEAATKTEVWTFRAVTPGKVTLYIGCICIDSPCAIPVRSHSVLVTVNP